MTLSRLVAAALVAALPVSAMASDIILTATVGGETHQFDLAALRAMEPTRVETTTIWTDGVQEFTGVSLHHFLGELDVSEGQIRATAINDYAIEIPVSDAVEGGPIIAYLRNGEEMSVRDKGPLWIVYPYDADPVYQSEVIYSRSIWQLDRIESLD